MASKLAAVGLNRPDHPAVGAEKLPEDPRGPSLWTASGAISAPVLLAATTLLFVLAFEITLIHHLLLAIGEGSAAHSAIRLLMYGRFRVACSRVALPWGLLKQRLFSFATTIGRLSCRRAPSAGSWACARWPSAEMPFLPLHGWQQPLAYSQASTPVAMQLQAGVVLKLGYGAGCVLRRDDGRHWAPGPRHRRAGLVSGWLRAPSMHLPDRPTMRRLVA